MFRRNLSLKGAFFFVVFFCVYGFLWGQRVGVPFIRNFLPKDYKGEAQVFSAAQDSRGVMYFANTAGILEFDGHRWRTTPLPYCVSLGKDKNQTIYASGNSDLGYLTVDSKGRTVFNSLRDYLPKDIELPPYFRFIQCTSTNIYWQSEGLILITPLVESSQLIPTAFSSQVKVIKSAEYLFQKLFVVKEKTYVYKKGTGLQQVAPNGVLIPLRGNSLKDKLVMTMFANLDNDIYILMQGEAFFLRENLVSRSNSSIAEILSANNIDVNESQITPQGDIVLGTVDAGIYILTSQGKLKYKLDKKTV